jgi:uncharacterized protein (DUF488 family)
VATSDRLTGSRARPDGALKPVFTIGHSTRTCDALIDLLRSAAIDRLVDVRSFPRSRTNPQFNRDTLAQALADVGIAYVHVPALGGRRGRQALRGPSPNTFWRNDGFRNFADWALGADFRQALDALRRMADTQLCAVMCAEAAWQRCHRQIIADWLVASGVDVRHIVATGRVEAARLNPAAVPQADGSVHYPDPQSSWPG